MADQTVPSMGSTSWSYRPFYFGGRMQIKSQDMALKGNALNAAKDLIAMRKEFRELKVEEAADNRELLYRSAIAQGQEVPANKVVAEWKQKHKAD